jgi:transcription elongation GreA/GreB family factor
MLKDLKVQLYNACQEYLAKRIDTAQQAIHAAQHAANDETKSSAGDKYETGRAMLQLDIEKNSVQLGEAMKLKQILDQIGTDHVTDIVRLGSLVITDNGNFYITISAGQVKLDDKIYMMISPASPIGAKLIGLKAGASFSFNNKTYKVKEIL